MTPPVRPARPAVVTVACWLQLGTLAILLFLLWLVLQDALDDQGRIDQALWWAPDADPAEVHGTRLFSVLWHAALGAPLLMLSLGLGLPGWAVCRGSNAARIVVFVAGGLHLLLLVLPWLALLLLVAAGPDILARPVRHSAFVDALNAGNRDPFGSLVETVAFLHLPVLLLLGAVVVLLSTPTADRWFVPRPGGRPLPTAPIPPAQILPGQLWPSP